MVHRLHNRNTGYSGGLTQKLTNNNQATLNATEGATALDLNNVVEENKIIERSSEQEEVKKEASTNSSLENISMENAAYLQNMENVSDDQDSKTNENMNTFEVDSIELATPELFSDNEENNSFNQDNNEIEPQIFDSPSPNEETKIKEPEMFEESTLEEDFEIPAFLRRQKN